MSAISKKTRLRQLVRDFEALGSAAGDRGQDFARACEASAEVAQILADALRDIEELQGRNALQKDRRDAARLDAPRPER